MRKAIILALAICTSFATAFAVDFDVTHFPKLTQYVEDFSNVLSPEQLATARTRANDYYKSTGEQAVTVLFPNRQGRELADIGLAIYRDNGIGLKKTSNGVLLLIATEEKKIRIVTGYGMEGKLPDVLASKIIENDIRPKVNAGDISGAVGIFYQRLAELPKEGTTGSKTAWTPLSEKDNSTFMLLIFLVPYLLGTFFGGVKLKLKKSILIQVAVVAIIAAVLWDYSYLIAEIVSLPAFLAGYFVGKSKGFTGGRFGGGGFSSGGGGSSGGFSWGGGSSGGGGAGD